jgi:L-ectoine synthase
MKVVKRKDIIDSERDVEFTGGNSLRFILAKDGMGYSFHETHVKKGIWHWHYKNHLESCYCISGHGWLHDLDNNKKHEIKEGTIYLLDNHDNHKFEALKDTILISVFNPAIIGGESHDKDGNYILLTQQNQ